MTPIENCWSAWIASMRCQILARSSRLALRQACHKLHQLDRLREIGRLAQLAGGLEDTGRTWATAAGPGPWAPVRPARYRRSACRCPDRSNTDIMASPENTRLRSRSRCEGLLNSLMPTSRQVSRISSSTSVCSVLSPAVSTMISSGRPSDRRRMPSGPALEPDLVEQLVGRLAVELRPLGLVFLAEQRTLRARPCCCSPWPGRNTAPG